MYINEILYQLIFGVVVLHDVILRTNYFKIVKEDMKFKNDSFDKF